MATEQSVTDIETMTLPAGTIVKVNGLPFRLPVDTFVEGSVNNLVGVAPPAPPECKTDGEKLAFAFGWWKAMEAQRAPSVCSLGQLELCPACCKGRLHPFDHEGLAMARCDNCRIEVNA